MKRILCTATVILFVMTAYAESIDKSTALYTAKNYLSSKGKVMLESKSAFRAPRKVASTVEQSYYYVFNAGNDQGYVIVSGDDRTPEVLGYVDSGTFDINQIPENMKSWLQQYADQIKAMDDNNVQVDKTRLMARRKITATRHSVPELLTTRWNQGKPYNLTCPQYYKSDGSTDLPATGCTATAMAQTIAYYKYPAKTKAIIPAITNTYNLGSGAKKTVTTKAIPRNSVIDWENMQDTYSCGDNHVHNAQDTAVANLMYYCGQAVGMGYGASSAANFNAKAFINYFGFDDSAKIINRSDCSVDQWFNNLYNEISTGHPVCFAGFSSGGGHAFVLDGFDGEGLFHVNWGWGGGSNGWFLCDVLNAGDSSGIGASSSSDGYSMGQYGLFGLKLPDNVRAETTTHMTIHEIEISGTSIKANYLNWTGSTNSFNCGIVKKNDDGTYSLVGSYSTISSMGANTYQNKTFNLARKLQPGTYILSPASRLTSNRTWIPEYNCYSEYIRADVDSSLNLTLTYVQPVEDLRIDTIVFPGNRKAGDKQEVKVTFHNYGDEYCKEIKFYASTTTNMVYTEYRSLVPIRKGETKEISFYFTPDEAGTYNLWFGTKNDGTDNIGTGTVEIGSSSLYNANLSVSGFTITNMLNSIIYGDRMVGKVNIKNNAKTKFDGKIKLALWRQPGGSGVAWSASSKTVEMSIEPARTGTATFEFSGLETGNKYYIGVSYDAGGELTNGSIWSHGWSASTGLLSWKVDGTIVGAASKTALAASATMCAYYVNGFKMTRITPNKNPNTFYAVMNGTSEPTGVANSNLIMDSHANHINLTDGYAYYAPSSFIADTASFTHVFPETTDGTSWETFTMPFTVDSVAVDSVVCENLTDSMNHFWIYEYAYDGNNHEVIFKPADVLRGNTPYIIAADKKLAGKSITFFGRDVNFYQSGSNKMMVTSDAYKFIGTTMQTSVKNAYVLAEDGKSFVYKTLSTKLTPMQTYFLSLLPDSMLVDSIPLPEVPESADKDEAGDLNGDGIVDGSDLVVLVNAVVSVEQGQTLPAAYDLSGDGMVDGTDVVILVNYIVEPKKDEGEESSAE